MKKLRLIAALLLARFEIVCAVAMGLLAYGMASVHTTWAQGPSAEEIMKRVEDRYQGDDFKAQVTLETSREGQTKTLTLKMLTRLYDREKMNYKVLVVVQAPEDSKDLAFLAWENEYPKPDDFWLYLPAVKLVKKVEPENQRQSLFGSVFNYQDATRRPAGADSHALLRTETLEGRATWVIESIPNEPTTAEFSRRVAWIDQASLMILKEELYDKQGNLLRVLRVNQQEQRTVTRSAGGSAVVWTAISATAENVQTQTTSTYTFSNVEYNTGIPESVFDPNNLGK